MEKDVMKDLVLGVQSEAACSGDFGEPFTTPNLDSAASLILNDLLGYEEADDIAATGADIRNKIKKNPELGKQLDNLEKDIDEYLRKVTPYFYDGSYKKYLDDLFPEFKTDQELEKKVIDNAFNFIYAANLK